MFCGIWTLLSYCLANLLQHELQYRFKIGLAPQWLFSMPQCKFKRAFIWVEGEAWLYLQTIPVVRQWYPLETLSHGGEFVCQGILIQVVPSHMLHCTGRVVWQVELFRLRRGHTNRPDEEASVRAMLEAFNVDNRPLARKTYHSKEVEDVTLVKGPQILEYVYKCFSAWWTCEYRHSRQA